MSKNTRSNYIIDSIKQDMSTLDNALKLQPVISSDDKSNLKNLAKNVRDQMNKMSDDEDVAELYGDTKAIQRAMQRPAGKTVSVQPSSQPRQQQSVFPPAASNIIPMTEDMDLDNDAGDNKRGGMLTETRSGNRPTLCNICKPVYCNPCYNWIAYWPIFGTQPDPSLRYEVNSYSELSNANTERWAETISTQLGATIPIKNLFRIDLTTGPCNFDFNVRVENTAEPPAVININPTSTTRGFQLNQFFFIKDPNITTDPDVTNIVGTGSFYNTADIYYNEFTDTTNNFDSTKNLLFTSQLFAVHMQQMKEHVRVSISYNTGNGDDLFKVCIFSACKIEIREEDIVVNVADDIVIRKQNVYVNGRYFMTYAYYINNIAGARVLPIATNKERPIQLARQLLFPGLPTATPLSAAPAVNDQQRLLKRLAASITVEPQN